MCTLHPFPRSHSAQPALEQQLILVVIALVERYGVEVAADMLHEAQMDVCKVALSRSLQ